MENAPKVEHFRIRARQEIISVKEQGETRGYGFLFCFQSIEKTYGWYSSSEEAIHKTTIGRWCAILRVDFASFISARSFDGRKFDSKKGHLPAKLQMRLPTLFFRLEYNILYAGTIVQKPEYLCVR